MNLTKNSDISDTTKTKHGDTMQYPMDFVGNKNA